MRRPSSRFWRHSATIFRRAWSQDASLGMTPSPDSGQVVVCSIQERSQETRPTQSSTAESILSSRFFDVLIPAVHPTSGADQFPAGTYPNGPAIRSDDTIQFGARKLQVMMDIDTLARGGLGLVYCAYCREVV